jgi:uncharacterized damage-inducible protein DinB
MPFSDPLDILITSDAYNTRKLLTLCQKLSHEQFHQKFQIGLGSLHDTLTHIISAGRRWTDRLAERPLRPGLLAVPQYPHVSTGAEIKDRTPADLLALLDDAERDLLAVAAKVRKDNRLASTLSMQWPGDDGKTKTYTFTRGCVFVHVTTHGYHHRAQCLNMLRQLNIAGLSDDLPDPSVVDWQAETELPPAITV